ncbi:Os04g0609550 [Oryza sativa Japonica Group]|uniref:Os04g0609550 protein n=1 Tax=Oryza sativa subsp. japonica TaxID=39947 RepID=A0A0P0WEJ9_ORYSJ|nr:Os04g0609550 [Oryza sativa Japonica Group]
MLARARASHGSWAPAPQGDARGRCAAVVCARLHPSRIASSQAYSGSALGGRRTTGIGEAQLRRLRGHRRRTCARSRASAHQLQRLPTTQP